PRKPRPTSRKGSRTPCPKRARNPGKTQLPFRRVSTRRSNLVLVLLIVLALVGVALLVVPGSPAHRGVKKGLDLQGGLEVVLKAQPPKGHKLTKADLDRSVEIMRSRVDKLG